MAIAEIGESISIPPVTGSSAPVTKAAAGESIRALVPPAPRRVWLGGWTEVPVYRLDGLPAGHELKGPAVFESATTTVLLREGEQAMVTPRGWLDIELGR